MASAPITYLVDKNSLKPLSFKLLKSCLTIKLNVSLYLYSLWQVKLTPLAV